MNKVIGSTVLGLWVLCVPYTLAQFHAYRELGVDASLCFVAVCLILAVAVVANTIIFFIRNQSAAVKFFVNAILTVLFLFFTALPAFLIVYKM